MHLVVYQHGHLKQLWTPVTWLLLVGAGYGVLRLGVDVLGALRRERSRTARRRAAATAATTPTPVPPAPPHG